MKLILGLLPSHLFRLEPANLPARSALAALALASGMAPRNADVPPRVNPFFARRRFR